jgi:hypothetical protein
MPSAKDQRKLEKALAEAASVFEGIDLSSIALVESQSDLIREAASVVAYFDMKESFREEICRGCGLPFAYAYYTTSVKHCSILCLKKMLEDAGLIWDPFKSYEERWGSRYVPAIVPSTAYAIIKQQAPPEKVQEEPIVVNNSIGAADLMARLSEIRHSG